MTISVIIPPYHEEKWIRQTLESVDRAKRYLLARGDSTVETLVVDNASADRTALIARSLNAKVVQESDHVISKVRNAGAKAASGDIFVFIDADVTIPEALLYRIAQILSDPSCIGGAVDTNYQPNSFSVKVYLQIWRMIAKAARWIGEISCKIDPMPPPFRREAASDMGC